MSVPLKSHHTITTLILSSLDSFQKTQLSISQTIHIYLYRNNVFSQALDFEKEVRIVFCDISKAFDPVRYEILIKYCGFRYIWISSYLVYLIGDQELFFLVCNQHATSYGLVFHKDLC